VLAKAQPTRSITTQRRAARRTISSIRRTIEVAPVVDRCITCRSTPVRLASHSSLPSALCHGYSTVREARARRRGLCCSPLTFGLTFTVLVLCALQLELGYCLARGLQTSLSLTLLLAADHWRYPLWPSVVLSGHLGGLRCYLLPPVIAHHRAHERYHGCCVPSSNIGEKLGIHASSPPHIPDDIAQSLCMNITTYQTARRKSRKALSPRNCKSEVGTTKRS